jgi:RNA polymerase sigma-70 factor (ECF subfamily)
MRERERRFVAGLYEEHAAALVAALGLSTGDREAAQDLAHEVFIRALGEDVSLSTHPDPRGWLFRTGYNLARNRWRVLTRRRHKLAREYPVIPADVWEDAVELRAAIQTLTRRQRDVITLHYLVGFSIAEIAGMLDCAEGTVRSHLQRGRVALGQMYDPQEAVQ